MLASRNRPDALIQSVVDMLMPELRDEDAAAERAFLQRNNLPLPSHLAERVASNSRPNGASANGDMQPPKRQRLSTQDCASEAASPYGQTSQGAATNRPPPQHDDNVTFYLLPSRDSTEQLPALDKNVLRTSSLITVKALAKFVVKKLGLSTTPAKRVSCATISASFLPIY